MCHWFCHIIYLTWRVEITKKKGFEQMSHTVSSLVQDGITIKSNLWIRLKLRFLDQIFSLLQNGNSFSDLNIFGLGISYSPQHQRSRKWPGLAGVVVHTTYFHSTLLLYLSPHCILNWLTWQGRLYKKLLLQVTFTHIYYSFTTFISATFESQALANGNKSLPY